MRLIFPALLLTLISGCASMENRNDPAKLPLSPLPADSGVVIISTGAPERCIASSTFLKILPATSSYYSREKALLSVDVYTLKSDFSDHQGNVHAIVLPAGHYYIAAWVANIYVRPIRVPKADFSVTAGEVVYLGEYFMPTACSFSATRSELRNKKDRDLQLANQKAPGLANFEVVTRIARFTGWAVGAPE